MYVLVCLLSVCIIYNISSSIVYVVMQHCLNLLRQFYPFLQLCSLIAFTWYAVVETIHLSTRALVVFGHLHQFVAFSPRDVCLFLCLCQCVCAASEYVCLDVDCVCAVHICIMFAIAGKGVCIKEITLKCYIPHKYIYLINSISAEVCVLS